MILPPATALGINDGACALLLASTPKVKELGFEPLAKLVDSCVAGVDPNEMGLGPVAAMSKLIERHNLTLEDIDLIEANEALLSVPVGFRVGLNIT